MDHFNKIKKWISYNGALKVGKIFFLAVSVCCLITCEKENKYCEKTCLDGYKAYTDMNCNCPEDSLSELELFRYYTKQFYEIDLKTDMDYFGWEKLDFSNGITSVFDSKQRLIIAMAKVLNLWEKDTLYTIATKRLAEIQKYCSKNLISSGDTMEWSGGLVSYIYYIAGIPLEKGTNEFWCLPFQGELTTYFIQNKDFIDFSKGEDRQKYIPDIGDFLVRDTLFSSNEDDHSMIILGPLMPHGIWNGKVIVLEGDVNASNHIDGEVTLSVQDVFNDLSIRGIGKRKINEPYIILFDELNYVVKDIHSNYKTWKLTTNTPILADLIPTADNLSSSVYLANRAKVSLFYDANYGGKSKTLSYSDSDLRLSDFHNCISSVKFE